MLRSIVQPSRRPPLPGITLGVAVARQDRRRPRARHGPVSPLLRRARHWRRCTIDGGMHGRIDGSIDRSIGAAAAAADVRDRFRPMVVIIAVRFPVLCCQRARARCRAWHVTSAATARLRTCTQTQRDTTRNMPDKSRHDTIRKHRQDATRQDTTRRDASTHRRTHTHTHCFGAHCIRDTDRARTHARCTAADVVATDTDATDDADDDDACGCCCAQPVARLCAASSPAQRRIRLRPPGRRPGRRPRPRRRRRTHLPLFRRRPTRAPPTRNMGAILARQSPDFAAAAKLCKSRRRGRHRRPRSQSLARTAAAHPLCSASRPPAPLCRRTAWPRHACRP